MSSEYWASASASEGFSFSCDLLSEAVACLLGRANRVEEPESPHAIEGLLVWCAVYYTAALLVLNWSLRLAMVQPLLRLAMTAYHGRSPSQVKLEKMAQSVMEALFYGGSFVVGVAVVSSEPWVFTPQEWFQDGRLLNRRVLSWYYVTYASRYLQGLVSVMLEHRRKDFFEMVLHHVVTLLLIYLSFAYDEMRIGAVIMVLFDPADVPLHIAKVFKYADDNTNTLQSTADAFFVAFAVVFIVSRMIIYPYMIAESFSYALFHLPPERNPGVLETSLLLWITVLWLINCYWGFLILKIGYNIFVKGVPGDDIRSDDEDDESEEPRVAKRKAKKNQ
eukprot:scaffold1237_cov243-Pinguiococcus_pyrenoidosus.AAC.19